MNVGLIIFNIIIYISFILSSQHASRLCDVTTKSNVSKIIIPWHLKNVNELTIIPYTYFIIHKGIQLSKERQYKL